MMLKVLSILSGASKDFALLLVRKHIFREVFTFIFERISHSDAFEAKVTAELLLELLKEFVTHHLTDSQKNHVP
jgi:hypothetical protein